MPTLPQGIFAAICLKKGIQRVDLSSRRVSATTLSFANSRHRLRTLLLTCYLRLLLTSTFRLREPSTIRALRPSTSRTTDFCSPGCPDDISGILLLDIEGRRTLTLTLTCSFALPRPTSAAFAA
ncbi:hypothetical protein FOTG_18082 [Fusarium oxysporum f. sp. vasinfectum 25433]|uniref:Uncharacterized protein n=1 Tax=Fusarium oxysporum f. sp. vasinfectum 25433 TaxID=1089449 RepID=X0KXE8_FUSOX|nr:hypothetical protein FOTG_18082 [Fusarium oxysporum f. sp. vasinfectum 25433]